MKSKFALFLFATAMLASCGNSSQDTGLSSGEQSAGLTSEPASSTYLDWVPQNKIVIDLFDVGSVQFTYGNAALSQASNTLDLSGTASIATSAQLEETQTVNFVYVTEASGFSSSVAVYSGIKGNELGNFLNESDDLSGKVRAYVAISFGSDVQWTKGKNAAMDARIQQFIAAAK